MKNLKQQQTHDHYYLVGIVVLYFTFIILLAVTLLSVVKYVIRMIIDLF